MAGSDVALLATFHRHVEDMRNLSLCKICIKPFYEPFILQCGHTYCYSCLASWFDGAKGRKSKKNCPDCRAKVKVQPSPNYLLRDLAHMFISRTELLPEDETVEEHQQAKEDEAGQLAADRAGPGLFKGAFKRQYSPRLRWGQGIMDPEDNVMRCPECHWELEDGECTQCGFHEYASDSEMNSDEDSLRSPSLGLDSDYDTEEEDLDHDFDGALPLDGYDSYGGPGSVTDVSESAGFYDDYDEMAGFIERDGPGEEEDDDDDDANSEATMTMRHPGHGGWGHYNGHSSYHYTDSDTDGSTTDHQRHPFHGHSNDSDGQTTTNGEISDVNTNYDSPTDDSDPESIRHPLLLRTAATRPRRVVISDDEEDEEDQDMSEEMSGASEDEEEEEVEEGEEGDNLSQMSENEAEGEGDSEDSDVRPPQPSARRRQHLQSQRARRDNHSYLPHAHSQRGLHAALHGSGARIQGHLRERNDVSQHGNPEHRHGHHNHDYVARGPNRRVTVEL